MAFKEGERCEKTISFYKKSVLEDKHDLSDAHEEKMVLSGGVI